jgi:hypothetical protein
MLEAEHYAIFHHSMYATSLVDTVLLNNYSCIVLSSIVSCTAELQVLYIPSLSPVRGERNATLCQLDGLTYLEIRGLQAKGLAGNWEIRGIAAMANACQESNCITKFYSENLEGREHLGDLGANKDNIKMDDVKRM